MVHNKFTKYLAHQIQRNINDLGFQVKAFFPRPSIKFIKETFNDRELNGAEIGVFKGENAKSILNTLNIGKIYLIDPYVDYPELYIYKEGDRRDYLKIAKKNLRLFPSNKLNWVFKFSSEAVNDIPNGLDFVYIDGNHNYKFVKEDIENYYRKLKSGGILCGHDIENGYGLHKIDNDVCKSLVEFVSKNKLHLYIQAPDWWIVKP